MDFSDLVAPPDQPTKPYWKVLEDYHRAQTSLPQEMAGVNVPQFSALLGPQYQEGQGADNAIRRGAGNIDIALHHLGGVEPGSTWKGPTLSETLGGQRTGVDLPQVTGEATRRLAAAVGAPESVQAGAQRFGESVPRQVVDIGVGGAVAGVPGMVALSSLGTYGETGKIAPTLLTGVTTALIPGASSLGSQTALRAVGAPLLRETLAPEALEAATKLTSRPEVTDLLGRYVPGSLTQRIAGVAGSQAGMLATGVAGDVAQVAARPEGWDDKWADIKKMVTPESLTETGLQQLPWTAMDLWHGRTPPQKAFEKNVVPAIKQDFKDNYTKAFQQTAGTTPSDEQVQAGMKVALGDAPATPTTGKVLASMGQAPTEVDKTPLHTQEGEWNPLEAVQLTKDYANALAGGRDTPVQLSTAHDLMIASALRNVEAQSEGKLSKADMMRQAALRVLVGVEHDNAVIDRISPSFLENEKSWERFLQSEKQKGEVEKKITDALNAGDPEVMKRMALVSGTPDKHWVDAGFPTASVTDESGATYDVAQPISIAKSPTSEETWQLKQSLLAQVNASQPNDPLSGDATHVARKAAFAYKEKVDWNDPKSVLKFYNFVASSARNAHVDFRRLRSGAATIEGEFANEKDALTHKQNLEEADRLNPQTEQGQWSKLNLVHLPAEGDKPERFRVVRQRYESNLSKDALEGWTGRVQDEGEPTVGERLAEGEQAQEGIPADHVDRLNVGEENFILDRLQAYDKLMDPGTREGSKAGFTQSVIDYLSALPESTMEKILLQDKEPFDVAGRRTSWRDKATTKAQLVKFVQYLRDGGDIRLKVEKQGDGSVKVLPVGDLTAMNQYFGVPAVGERTGENGKFGYNTANTNKRPFLDVGAGQRQGMTLFEQFHLIAKTMQRELQDPRWRQTMRPRGDYGFIPREYAAKLVGDEWQKDSKVYLEPPDRSGYARVTEPSAWRSAQEAEGNLLVVQKPDGTLQRLEGGVNPLRTFLMESARNNYTTTARNFVQLLEAYGKDLDPNLMNMARAFVKQEYGANVRIGVGISKDFNRKALYSYNDSLTSNGILLSPFSPPPDARYAVSLDNPKDIVQHLVHEMAHAHTVFGYDFDPKVRAEVDKVYAYLKDRQAQDMQLTRENGFQANNLHALTNPYEMLASIHNDGVFQHWLKQYADPFGPLPEQTGATVFDRLLAVMKRVWTRMVGPDAAGTMAERVMSLSQQVMQTQEGLRQRLGIENAVDVHAGFQHEADRMGDLVQQHQPKVWLPTAPTGATTLGFGGAPEPTGVREGVEPTARAQYAPQATMREWREARAYLNMVESQVQGFKGTPEELAQLQQGLEVAKQVEATKRAEAVKTGFMRTGNLLESRLSAGAGFYFGLPDVDKDEKGIWRLAGKPIGRSGFVGPQGFKSITNLKDAEIALYKQLVPEAFTQAGVNVPKLVEGLKTNGPVVEVRKLTETPNSEEAGRNRAATLQHQLETIPGVDVQSGMVDPGETTVMFGDKQMVDDSYFDKKDFDPQEHVWADKVLTPEQYTLYQEWVTAMNNWIGGEHDPSSASYSSISTKPQAEMPGYVEGLVRVPHDPNRGLSKLDIENGKRMAVKYSGPHFGSEDTNVLSFYRGYEETLPDGTKAFHVIEVQSDWAQRNRDVQDSIKSGKLDPNSLAAKEPSHPLLRVYESLALKAAIAHAKEVGATKVILSDAETAMMTEGHDRQNVRAWQPTEENKIAARKIADDPKASGHANTIAESILDGKPSMATGIDTDYEKVLRDKYGLVVSAGLPQEVGMRLHYDQTLPSAMEKLTGEKGERVELGVHKMVDQDVRIGNTVGPLGGSPVFRDASGNSKTQITGRVYDISKTTPQLEQRQTGLLESRTSPSHIIDSLNAYSDHMTEDKDKYWFRPMDATHFIATYGGALGDKLQPIVRGGQQGFSLSKRDLAHIGAEDVDAMPRPKVDPSTISSFEVLKRIAKQQGASEDDASAQAGFGMQFASILKNPDTHFGVLSYPLKDKYKAAGLAFGTTNVAALNRELGVPKATKTIAHEATHSWGMFDDERARATLPSYVSEAYDQVKESFDRLSVGERTDLISSLQRLSDEQLGLKYSGYYEAAAHKPSEFAAEFIEHTAGMLTQLAKPSQYLKNALRFVPDDMSNLLQRLVLSRSEGMDALKQTIDRSAAEYGKSSTNTNKVVDEVASVLKQYARSAAETAEDQAEFFRMRLLYPDMYKETLQGVADRLNQFNQQYKTFGESVGTPSLVYAPHLLESRVTDWMKPAAEALGWTKTKGDTEKVSLWNKVLGNMTTLRNQYPVLSPLYDALFDAQGAEHHRRMQVMSAAAGAQKGDRVVDDARTKQFVQFIKSPKLQDVFSKIALDLQITGDRRFDALLKEAGGNVMNIDPHSLADLYDYHTEQFQHYNLSPDERNILDTVFTGTRNQITMTNVNLINSHMETIKGIAAMAIQKATQLPPEQSRLAATALHDALQAATQGDFQTMQQKSTQFSQMVQDPKVRDTISQMVQEGVTKGQEFERFLSLRMPYFMSERRGGSYAVWWKDDEGKMQREYFENSTKRQQYIESKGLKVEKLVNPTGDRMAALDDRMLDKLNEIQDKIKARIVGLFGDQQGTDLAAAVDFTSELRDAMNAQQVTKAMGAREQPKSREDLNMFGVHQNYVNSVLSAVKARQVRLEAELYLGSAEFDDKPVLKNMVKQHVESMLAPDTQVGRTAQAVNFIYYMGGNLSSMLLHTFQQLQSVAPALTQRGDSVAGAYSRLKDVNTMMVRARTQGGYADPELNAAVNRARVEKVIDSGPLSEFDHSTDLSLINRLRVTQGASQIGVFELLKNRLFQASNLARRFYSVLPVWNSEAAFVAAFQQARELGKDPTAAYNEARFLKNQTIFGGGKADRPIGLFAVNDKYGVGRTAAQMIWSLQTFETGMLNLMGQYVRSSLNPKGLTPAQAKQVRKSAAQMLVVQTALAGTLGLPFVGAALTTLNKLFPDHNPELSVRDFLNNLVGDDKGMGGVWGSALATGIPSAFDSSPDMGSRLALHGVLGASAYSGLQPDQIFGPTGSLVGNLIKGMQSGARGEPAGTVQAMMPRGFLRIWNGLREGSSFISPSTGQPLVGDLTPAERLERLVGYTPARVARLRDAEHLAKLSETAEQADRAKFVSKQAMLMEQPGAEDTVRQNIVQRSVDRKGVETPRDLSMAVSKRYEETHVPFDTRNIGSKSTLDQARALRGVLGTQEPSPAYADRVSLQQSIAARLGLGMPSGGAIRHATTLDAVMQMYPFLTTPQARVLTDRQEASQVDRQSLGLSGIF